jgi:O-antigen/teichoic acid export membrane protein
MTSLDPQFLYMILVLPSLFGLTLLGEGINKVVHEEWNGIVSVIFGLMFIGMVAFAYFFFASYLAHRGV